MANWILGEVS